MKRYPYDAKALTAGKGEEVVSLAGLSGGHWTRTVLFDRAGQKMYVGVGSGSNVPPPTRSSPAARATRSASIGIRTAWMLAPDNRDVWGRPVAVLMLNDGSLLISDDGGRKIWRVSYGGTKS